MGGGVLVLKSGKRYNILVVAYDSMYDGCKERCDKYGLEFVGGRKGISDSVIDEFSLEVANLVDRLNSGESLNVNLELEKLCSVRSDER